MIKLGIFIIDPVRAYEMYEKEILALQNQLDKQLNLNEALKKHVKALTVKLSDLNIQHASYNNVDCWVISEVMDRLTKAGVNVK